MATEQPLFKVGTLKAAADLSAKQYRCLKVTADETLNIATAAGENIFGVLQDKPLAGAPCEMMCIGITKLVIGAGGLAAGAIWETAADGSGITVAAAKVGLGTVIKGGAAGELATVSIGFAQGATIP